MIPWQRRRILWLVVQCLCSGGSAISCNCGTLSWLGWSSGVSWGGGSTDLYPHSCRCRIRHICPDASRVRTPWRCVQKDTDTSETASLTVLWRSLDLFVVPNWFLCTDVSNDDTRILLSTCGIPYRNLFLMTMCVRNMQHLSHLLDCLATVTLAITSFVLRITLVKISRK